MKLIIANKNYSSWSLRAWILMRVLEIPFEERQVFYGADNREVFGKFSPTALVPCLVDGATTVWESLAIAEYLHEQHPKVWPHDHVARAFARSCASEMHGGFTALRSICNMNCGIRVALPSISEPLQKDLNRLQSIFEEGISRFGGPYLAGAHFTAVDAFFAPIAFRQQTYGFTLGDVGDAYLRCLLGLQEMQQWYAAGLMETQRSQLHESSIVGTVTDDFRAV